MADLNQSLFAIKQASQLKESIDEVIKGGRLKLGKFCKNHIWRKASFREILPQYVSLIVVSTQVGGS
jgi:hypothetical protein